LQFSAARPREETELADEADALRTNVDGLRALSASLDVFNESFASWMYVMNMNALTVEWPEVHAIVVILQNIVVHFFFLSR
jgi:DASH complex subunit Dam1